MFTDFSYTASASSAAVVSNPNSPDSRTAEDRRFGGVDRPTVTSEESPPASEDPLHVYLAEMGSFPLLTRQQEIELAKEVEHNRSRFRAILLDFDFVLRDAIDILQRVHVGELGFDRTLQAALSDQLEKHQIQGRLPHNLRTLEALVQRNQQDYLTVVGTRSVRQRRALWQRLVDRRRRAAKLVEELGLRIERLEPHLETVIEIERRVRAIRPELDHPELDQQSLVFKSADDELSQLLQSVQHTPASLTQQVTELREAYSKYQSAKRRLVRGKPAVGRVDRQEIQKPRSRLFGSDSRRQCRADPRSGEI